MSNSDDLDYAADNFGGRRDATSERDEGERLGDTIGGEV
jgi:hypothetical protein